MRRLYSGALLLALLLTACDDQSPQSAPATDQAALQVAPQNTELLLGVDRVAFAILDHDGKPVLGAKATVDLTTRGASTPVGTFSLQFVGPEYGNIPVYLGTAKFTRAGEVEFVVHATLSDGTQRTGAAFQKVLSRASQLPVGHNVREIKQLKQPVARDVNGDLARLDSAVKDGKSAPDPWHDATIEDGLTQNRPMVLYFGEPGRCLTATCGPTVDVLTRLAAQYGDRLLFEHIEVHYPANAETYNQVYVAFGLQSEPWIFFVNSDGVVSDRFEGPVTLDELRTAADGTLAGKVPAVDLSVP